MTSYCTIIPQICGYVDREVLEHMARNGLEVSTSNLDQDSKCGGHSTLRSIIDYICANSLTRCMRTDENSLLLDVGAKYGSNLPMLRKATRRSELIYINFEDNFLYRNTYVLKLVATIWDQDLVIKATFLERD